MDSLSHVGKGQSCPETGEGSHSLSVVWSVYWWRSVLRCKLRKGIRGVLIAANNSITDGRSDIA